MSAKFRSLEATSKMLETFFKNTLGDSVTTQEIYNSWGRASEDEKKNKAWLFTCLRHLKHHKLVTTISERRRSRDVVVGLKLTERGKTILGKNRDVGPVASTTTSTPTSTIQDLTYGTMIDLVQRFFREHSEYEEVGFRVKSESGEYVTELKRNEEK